ncbi:hypothetical protein EHI8A_006950 [Entamoeba histolytica HM-1:IMSS-B]|uniref:Uncharacterized protein n=6 Tax=Entamoeba histolytica TaxID=5759 RepID=C4LZR7_ENTH1|nr:hypothetical protein EHI_038950 [Entamoeba histolytica HM-1:IMSS]EMD44497.1 Hypothetical protein EHI5A_020800 [Entamoeba histolytica KU27]EMH75043.1 hypothetical protein EHI8A_006950 [Entamoeba histolytica HM-1:IMSS-B]EMS14065.1 hypothetical protein KM1_022950 [Entamoeba histolytica HM-3:IMSS]ENY64881.1 hypothetical protein EHI7A_009470 [Entamoeba histolytica HM-1:IMSS-A]GAT94372.1 hypothetical protein CL6EHI_038950 [Entamoeba histolytica]|eukprot:XP_656883.1 hypothetical protein EHI_038950 [Entamoeba histolytica HM-1:IMSS]
MSNSPNIPPLKSDFMTKLKQIIVAIPNSELIMKGRYKEVFETQSFEEFLLKMVSAAREFMGSTTIDNETKFNLFFSYHYYVDLLCESMADKSVSFNQMNLLAQMKEPLPSTNSPRSENEPPGLPVASQNDNIDQTPDIVPNHSLLLEKLSSATEQQLEKILEIVAPQNTDWCIGMDLSTMSVDVIEQISSILLQQ